MSNLTQNGYRQRLIDEKMEQYLMLFGAISLEGPKWCGKTWTALNHAHSVVYLSQKETRELASESLKTIFKNDYPELIDEWQLVPSIWDEVRINCDIDNVKGKFILTGSTTLNFDSDEKIYHSGAGRIVSLKMFPMSLYESGDSTGDVSLLDLYNESVKIKKIKSTTKEQIAYLIIRGGWPANVTTPKENAGFVPEGYIDAIIKTDIHERKDRKRDSKKMRMLLCSLARNESAVAGYETIAKDISEYESGNELIKTRQTVADYMDVLNSLYLLNNISAFSINYRSSKRIGKSPKRHLIDPSLSCALLGITIEKLLNDSNTFGLMFESLAIRDLTIYMDYLKGNIFHFRDNVSGDEVDAILEFKDGSYGAVEIKLSNLGIEEAKKSLLRFYENVNKKPKFMAIIVGTYGAILKDEKTGIYILPLTALKP